MAHLPQLGRPMKRPSHPRARSQSSMLRPARTPVIRLPIRLRPSEDLSVGAQLKA
jgi:hypothetical protein